MREKPIQNNKGTVPKQLVGKNFQKGKSGNPGGRPKTIGEVQELARQHTVMAIERLAEWAMSDNPKASVAATQALLDRGWGKAAQPIGDGEGGQIIVQVVRLSDEGQSR